MEPRQLDGWVRGRGEASTLLGITAENQRVLLHRARGRIRQTIDMVIASRRPTAAARAANRPPAWAVCCCRRVNIDPTDWLTRVMMLS